MATLPGDKVAADEADEEAKSLAAHRALAKTFLAPRHPLTHFFQMYSNHIMYIYSLIFYLYSSASDLSSASVATQLVFARARLSRLARCADHRALLDLGTLLGHTVK